MVAADNVKRPKALKISIQLFKLFLVILNSIVANNYQKKSMPDSPILFKFLQNATTLNKFVEHCNFVVQVLSLSLSLSLYLFFKNIKFFNWKLFCFKSLQNHM